MKRCKALTKSGTRCQFSVRHCDGDYCGIHERAIGPAVTPEYWDHQYVAHMVHLRVRIRSVCGNTDGFKLSPGERA